MTEQPWNFKRWTSDQIKILKEMWAQARPVEDIAALLGTPVISVLAKADSLGLLEPSKRVSLNAFARKKGEPVPLTKDDGTPTTLANARDNQCRWMPGPPSMESPVCGHPVKAKSWCAFHLKRVFVGGGW